MSKAHEIIVRGLRRQFPCLWKIFPFMNSKIIHMNIKMFSTNRKVSCNRIQPIESIVTDLDKLSALPLDPNINDQYLQNKFRQMNNKVEKNWCNVFHPLEGLHRNKVNGIVYVYEGRDIYIYIKFFPDISGDIVQLILFNFLTLFFLSSHFL